jgi:hypothetical protein
VLLDGWWDFVGGFNLKITKPSGIVIQNAYYNGWFGYTACSSVIVWKSDYLVGYFAGHYHGFWHGAIAMCGVYAKLNEHCEGKFCVAADSAFPKPTTCPHIMRVDKEGDQDHLNLLDHETKYHIALQNSLIVVRQAVEWGMGKFQADE